MKKLIFLIIFLLVTVPLLAGPEVFLSKQFIDLGQLSEGKIYEHDFYIENLGDADLVVDVIRVSCGCVKILDPTEKFTVRPKEKSKIKFSFNTTGYQGDVIKYIYIKTNDPNASNLKVLVKVNVVPYTPTIIDRFKGFRPLTVITAGLVDGINPCAFTVLVFFISFLSFVGYKRRAIFILGSFFILAVFLTYFAIGLGIFEFFRNLEIFTALSKFIYLFTGFLALALGFYSLYDYWIYKKTKDPEKMKLKLPQPIKNRIHGVIRDKTDFRKDNTLNKASALRLMMVALSCGFIVTLLESVCTGQLYLPTIVYVLKVAPLKMIAILYLLIYNVMFIIPLLLIFGLAFFGMGSDAFARLAHKHLAKVKAITAGVFFGLALALFFIAK